MRPTPTVSPGRIPAIAALLFLGAGAGCGDVTRPDEDVHFVAIVVPDSQLRPGFWMQAVAEPLDAAGRVLEGRTVTWRSLTPTTLAVGVDGRLLALAPGEGRARASVGSVSSVIRLDLRNPPVASVVLSADTARLLLPAGTQQLVAVARDAEGVEILRPGIRWESSASRIADVATNGRVSAVAAGRADVIAIAEDLADTIVVLVEAPASPTAPQIVGTAPGSVTPGQTLVVTGNGFAATTAGNTVLLDGIPVAVSAASPTQLTLTLPAAAQFACRATGPAALQVTTAGGIGVATVTLQTAAQRALAPGQSVVLATVAEARCIELAPSDGRYLITVQNVARVVGTQTIAVTVGGAATDPAAASLRAHATVRAIQATPNRVGSLSVGSGTARGTFAGARLAALAVPTPGEVVPLRIANLDNPDPCAVFTPIGARTVFVGPHVVILEDTTPTLNGAPTLRGMIDPLYAQLGQEFETTVWPILERFGNPLAMDARLDANGRLAIVFTPRMNQMLGGAALAAALPCDFFSRAQQPSSNVGEFLYAQVPTSTGPGAGPGTTARWMAEIRATIAHESKHIVSMAERYVRGFPQEDPWLEEATARISEELFARAIYGTQQLGDHGFAATLRCEIFLGGEGSPCADSPRALLPHLGGLWEYLDRPTARSPLGATAANDLSWYGSGWAFVRWVIDQGLVTETAFLTALTQGPLSGLANIEARAGRSWEQMLGEWTLALALDGRPGFIPADPRGRFPSWDLHSLFGGLCSAIGPCDGLSMGTLFTRAHPLEPRPVTTGGLAIEIPAMVGGGFFAIELSGGSPTSRQLLQLRGYRGAPLPTSARMAVVRID